MLRHLSIGAIFCAALPAAAALGTAADDQAAKILEAAGAEGGLIVHLGCGDGQLTAALRAGERYLVHGLDANADNVARAREHVLRLGLYGPVSVDRFDGRHLPYIDNVVNLLVVEEPGGVSPDERMRVLAPDGVAMVKQGAQWRKIVKPRPPQIDAWTHFLHGADGNAVGEDAVVAAPFHLQWVGGPHYARSHEALSSVNVVVSDGRRIYYVADDAPVALPEQLPTQWVLAARDAFNGVLLWKRPLSRWQARSMGSRHLFPPDLFRRLVAGQRAVYATLSIFGPVTALDPATGKTMRVYQDTDKTEEILYDQGVLYLVVNPAPAEKIDRGLLARTLTLAEPKQLMAVEADTGRTLWTKNDPDTVGLIPMATAERAGSLVFQNPRELVCLDAGTGTVRWRTKKPSPKPRPVWSTSTVVIQDDVVLSADHIAPDPGAKAGKIKQRRASELTAYDLHGGRPLWKTPCAEGSHVPNEVFVVDGIVWAGEQPQRSQRDYQIGRDLHTGEVKIKLPPSDGWVDYHHHRCYRDKATRRFILAGRTGVEFIDLQSGRLTPHHWIRGICKFGVLPCNGLLYLPPNQCSCYQESLLNGFRSLAPRRTTPAEPAAAVDEPRLEHGPAYGQVQEEAAAGAADDWPTYRGDAARSGSTAGRVPGRLAESWKTRIAGGLTPPVIAGGRVYVAAADRHTVFALDCGSGKTLWRYTAGGRVDSPPTVAGGLVVFGCRDGWVYALRAADGVLAWRYRAAPVDRRLVADGQCESVWPVHGSVLVDDGRVSFAAGRSSYLDGGVVCCVVELKTGETIVRRRYSSRDAETGVQKAIYRPFAGALLPDRELPGLLSDVPASDGTHLFLRSVAFDRRFHPLDKYVQHLFAAAGFLDDGWYQRLFWIYGNHLFSGLAGRSFNRQVPCAGRILVDDDDTLYGYRDYTLGDEGVFAVEKTPELGMFDSQFPPPKGRLKASRPESHRGTLGTNRWRLDVPFYVRAIVSTGNGLLLAGPPKYEPDAAHAMIANRPVDTNPLPPLLQTALAAWKGDQGGRLWIVNKQDGTKQAEYTLPSPPRQDGIAVARGRVYLVLQDGTVACMGPAP